MEYVPIYVSRKPLNDSQRYSNISGETLTSGNLANSRDDIWFILMIVFFALFLIVLIFIPIISLSSSPTPVKNTDTPSENYTLRGKVLGDENRRLVSPIYSSETFQVSKPETSNSSTTNLIDFSSDPQVISKPTPVNPREEYFIVSKNSGFNLPSKETIEGVCQIFGARSATVTDFKSAWRDGFESCADVAVREDDSVGYYRSVQNLIGVCGLPNSQSSPGLYKLHWNNKSHGVGCVGVKPGSTNMTYQKQGYQIFPWDQISWSKYSQDYRGATCRVSDPKDWNLRRNRYAMMTSHEPAFRVSFNKECILKRGCPTIGPDRRSYCLTTT